MWSEKTNMLNQCLQIPGKLSKNVQYFVTGIILVGFYIDAFDISHIIIGVKLKS